MVSVRLYYSTFGALHTGEYSNRTGSFHKKRFHGSDKAKRPPCYLVWLCERVGLEHWVALFEAVFIACTGSTENSDVVAPQPTIHCICQDFQPPCVLNTIGIIANYLMIGFDMYLSVFVESMHQIE